MSRAALFIAMALVLIFPVPASALDIDHVVTRLQRWLWPPKPVPLPVAAPLPKSAPEPAALPRVIEREGAPNIVEPALPPLAPSATQPRRKGKPLRRVRADDGPDLPYSCVTVRWAAAMFSRDYLEEQGRARGITERQRRQAQACLTGKN